MPATVSTNVRHHGKRHRLAVTAKDDSPEAFEAALRELQEQAQSFRGEIAPKVERQSYQKRKGR
jgi:hypothetical protein